jgi:hypothetical protein
MSSGPTIAIPPLAAAIVLPGAATKRARVVLFVTGRKEGSPTRMMPAAVSYGSGPAILRRAAPSALAEQNHGKRRSPATREFVT